ncbi:MAG: TIR domain-containing protein [Anaerolineae bacterium]|nr:TIR domain-containing protein [Anaerolineae bacterium]
MTLQVFVSYKSEYRDFARKVRDQLRGWGYETWFDMDNIPKGAYFRHAIQEGLDASDVLVSVITPEAQNSREVMAEVDYFLSQNKPLVPLKRGDFKLLYIFITIQYIDFTRDEAEAFADLHKRLAELAAAESPAAPPAEEALPEPEPADGKKADGLPLPPAPPAAIEPQRQPSPTPMQPPTYHEPVKRKAAFTRYLLPAVAMIALVSVGALVLVSSLGSLNISMTASPQFQWWIPLLAIAVTGGLALWWRWGRRSSSLGQIEFDDSNRARMLDKVYDFWVVGVLENALQESGAFDVGLAAAPGAVLRHKDYGDYPLPPNAKIIDIFNDLNRELLILGAPGAGKTILLLQLAKALVEVARRQALTPSPSPSGRGENAIPVVFNLSSWAAEHKPLNEWIVEELRLRYQVPKKVAEMWVAEQALLLLLDGLDEVAEPYRDACVDAINAFREQYPAVDIAVCSRIADYDMLTRKLDLRGAVTLKPLNDEQIDEYINRPELNGLRQVMSEDSVLREMATTPFLLNAMAYAYQGLGADALRLPDEGIESRRTRLLNVWVEKRLAGRYKVEQVRHYLTWLADKLVTFGQSIFYIEELQPEWLKDRERFWYKSSFVTICGVVFAVVFGTAISLIQNYFSWQSPFELNDLSQGLRISFPISLLLVFLLIRSKRVSKIKVIETIQWYWDPSVWSIGEKRLFFLGLFVCILLLLLGLWVLGLALALIVVFAYGLIPNLNLQIRKKANQGFWQSARNGFFIGVVAGLLLGIATGVAFGPVDGRAIGLPLGIVVGMISGAGFGFFAVMQHITLRVLLVLIRVAPWNYARFLDTCAKIGLLRKVGGGYIFAHRYLLEYFAGIESSAGK